MTSAITGESLGSLSTDQLKDNKIKTDISAFLTGLGLDPAKAWNGSY